MSKFLHAVLISGLLVLLCGASVAADAAPPNKPASDTDALQLWQIQRTLASKKYVDLTHEFAPGIPRWPGFPDETRKTIYWYDPPKDGSAAADKRPDQINPKEMILPLVVIDVHEEAAKNPDYTLSLRSREKVGERSGQIPAGAFVGDAH